MYRVLWIDDEHSDEELIPFIIEAKQKGFYLNGFPSYKEGFQVLEKNLELYDVILLDGMFFEKKDQEIGTEDESGIGMAIRKINQLSSKKAFPWFVLSGKDKFTKGENMLLKANKAQCFDKTNPLDVIQLFKEMKSAAENQPDFQLKHQYSNILKVCANKYIGANQFERLFSLVKDIENNDSIEKTGDLLNPIRKIIEALFVRLSELGIIPQEILDNKGWINSSSRFLANKHNDYIHTSELIHPLVVENIHSLLKITQDASHGTGNLTYRVDEYLQNSSTDFLYKSTIYLLFDILMWFKEFIDSNGDVETNKTLWRRRTPDDDWVEGEITNISENGWANFQPNNALWYAGIHPRIGAEHKLQVADQIKVKTRNQIRIEEVKK